MAIMAEIEARKRGEAGGVPAVREDRIREPESRPLLP